MREGDVLRRRTLLRSLHREIRLGPRTGGKPSTRRVRVTAKLETLTRSLVVSPTGHVPGALLVRAYLLLSAYAALRFQARGEWRVTSST